MTVMLDHYSVEELETLCEPTYKAESIRLEETHLEASALAQKKEIAKRLAPIFKTGDKHTARDEWKAAKYQQISESNTVETPDSTIRTATLFDFHGLLNSFRLFLVRVHRFVVVAGLVILPRLFALWGLSCGLTLLADIVIVLKNTFIDDLALKNKIKDARESDASFGFLQKLNLILRALITTDYWRRAKYRFINSILKDNRPARMANDALWFGLNLALFLVTGPIGLLLITPLLNLIGFTFDAGMSGFLTGKRYVHMTNIIDKLNAQIEALDSLKNKTPEHIRSISTLTFMRENMKKERRENMKTRVRNTIFLSLVLVGMVLIFAFPPLTAPIGFAIGSALALTFGTATGFYPKAVAWRKKIYGHCKELFNRGGNNHRHIQRNSIAADQAPLLAAPESAAANNIVLLSPTPTLSSTATTTSQLQAQAVFSEKPDEYKYVQLEVVGSGMSPSLSPVPTGNNIGRAESSGSTGTDPGSASAATPPAESGGLSLTASTAEAYDPDDSRSLAVSQEMKKKYSSAVDLAYVPQALKGMQLNNAH